MHAATFHRLFAALVGLCFAAWLYGWRVIDPSSVQWLLHGDPAQHYIGSVFFRSEAWHWPPGLIERFGDAPTSVVFTDSIPLLALPAKLLAHMGLWPAPWQYFGLWMLACHALAGWHGVALLQRMGVQGDAGQGRAVLWCGAFFFITAPVLLLRAYGHEALMAQFIVLAALALCAGASLWRWRTWTAWCALAVLVHPYLALMTALLGVAAAMDALRIGAVRWPQLLRQGVVAALVLGALAWLAGYTVGQGQRSASGFGVFSANLLTWIDPMDWHAFSTTHQRLTPYIGEWSALLPAQQQATGGQYEGFAYLGAGMLLVMACAVVATVMTALTKAPTKSFIKPITKPFTKPISRPVPIPVWICAALMALWAASTRVTLGAITLTTVPLPAPLEVAAGVFRASGRLVWPLTYLLMALALARLAHARLARVRLARVRASPLAGVVIVLLAVLLQAYDTHGKWLEFRARFRVGPPGIVQPLQSPQWGRLLARCPNLQLLTLQQDITQWEAPALLAAQQGARFAPAPTARAVPITEAQRREQMLRVLPGGANANANAPANTVYLVHPSAQVLLAQASQAGDKPDLRMQTIEGWTVMARDECGVPTISE